MPHVVRRQDPGSSLVRLSENSIPEARERPMMVERNSRARASRTAYYVRVVP